MSTDVRLTVRPGPPLAGTFVPPGDKSITHRAYLLGLLSRGETRIENPNPGQDCEATLACAVALGARVTRHDGAVAITGCDHRLREPDQPLDCGNSGTTLRLLAGVLAAQSFLSILTGDDSLRRRPVARVIEPLRRMGAQLWARDADRLPPLAIRGGTLRAIEYALPVASAQVASCVLLAGLSVPGRTSVTLPGPARDHTERMLPVFGVEVKTEFAQATGGRTTSVSGPARLTATSLRVAGDFSAAAFFLAAAAACPGAVVTAREVNLNPTRTGLLDVLARMGARVERTNLRQEAGEPVGDVTVSGPDRLIGCDIAAHEVPTLIDEVPAWVIAATAARGVSRIQGAAELRVKESDRLAALADNLTRLGIIVRQTGEGLEITGGEVREGVLDAAGDHRLAMAFAVLGSRAAGTIRIEGADGIPTSYPGFHDTFAKLGGGLEAAAARSGR